MNGRAFDDERALGELLEMSVLHRVDHVERRERLGRLHERLIEPLAQVQVERAMLGREPVEAVGPLAATRLVAFCCARAIVQVNNPFLVGVFSRDVFAFVNGTKLNRRMLFE